jgi:hypothetical protein
VPRGLLPHSLTPLSLLFLAAWTPVRTAVICENEGRTKVCPAFVRGFIDDSGALVYSPLAEAQIVLHVDATDRENDDHILFRFTSTVAGVPAAFEITQDVSTRATDDEQRAILRPAFLRAVEPYVAVLVPDAVQVTIAKPDTSVPEVKPKTSPWSFSINAGGFWNWSAQYQMANLFSSIALSRMTRTDRLTIAAGANYMLSRQPDLVASDGTHTYLGTDAYGGWGRVTVAHNLNAKDAIGGVFRAGADDPLGRYAWTFRLHAGISHDWFPSDDPRGNQLSVGYFVGVQADRYNVQDELGETTAYFPTHGVVGMASVRKDHVTYGLNLSAATEIMIGIQRRVVLEADPSIQLQLGAHVDLELSGGITDQIIPGPDLTKIDPNDFAQISRLQYAQPLQINIFANVQFHWDRTDPSRNNRFSTADTLGNTSTL